MSYGYKKFLLLLMFCWIILLKFTIHRSSKNVISDLRFRAINVKIALIPYKKVSATVRYIVNRRFGSWSCCASNYMKLQTRPCESKLKSLWLYSKMPLTHYLSVSCYWTVEILATHNF